MIKFPENFISTVQGILDETYKIVHVYVESLNDGLIDGHYLYMNGNKLILVKKSTVIKQGYVYNSTITTTEKIYTWKLLCFEIPISCETKEEVLETPQLKADGLIPQGETPQLKADGLIPQGETPQLKADGLILQEENPIETIPEKNIEINAILEDLPQIQFDLDEICKSLETIHITWDPARD